MFRHVLTATTLAVSLAAIAPPATAVAAARRDTAQLQDLARKLVAAGAPGVIVRVDAGRGRPIEITAQAPWAKKDHLLKAGDEYRVASNTKTMIATIVLQLAAEGRLALSDPVEKWLPGKVPGGE